jgi:hypothetical protein
MLTRPEVAEKRAAFEGLPSGQVTEDIRSAIAELRKLGLSKNEIKFYKGCPSVFGIATSDKMLLNPYPNQEQSHHCFTLIATDTKDENDIYNKYKKCHFERPWEKAEDVPEKLWNNKVKTRRTKKKA